MTDPTDPVPSGARPTLLDDAATRRILRWLPFAMAGHLLVGVPALIISLVVAYATFVQAGATQRMQQAAAWPIVAARTTNYTTAGERVVALSLVNDGLGPALIGPVEVRYRGRAVATPTALLAACCGYRAGQTMQLRGTPIVQTALRPGQEVSFIGVPGVPANAGLVDRFDAARRHVTVRACYCSIFEECWTIAGEQAKPQRVAQCPADWTVLRAG
ncbi:hypothetical protein SAMN06297144_1114 [Sphingomonas guangdongensis]|uniref:Uncharacterized protein n=1 Tax=Sphingomonas guangdongensis TaxID=1141890 RepID=A0A285QGE1_9SPHN|nr:hypothetical protein [Sphingomonas guangdongensis]SOB80544.1 hypothetical protein SAMN06297144_1114 [Sphingomonas guangdongensis]